MLDLLSRRRFRGGSAAVPASGRAAPLLAACGGSGGSAGKATEINTLLITSGASYPRYWQKTTTEFRRQTAIKVNYDLLEFTPLTSKEITLAAARSAQYDVYSTHTAQIGAFFSSFEPLNHYVSSTDLADFFSVSLKYLTNPESGELAAIPRNIDARSRYYRADLYGLMPAKTWDELVDAGNNTAVPVRKCAS